MTAEKNNDQNVQDQNPEESDEEGTLTFEEIIDIEESLENQAEALLGGHNDMVCTYPEGYKYRQPLYSCRTCSEKTGKQAGICYACSLHCHADHQLVELFTKRKFCCDCGNSKFQSKCSLFEKKSSLNHRNKYDDNFDGIFCVCKKPYPDDESESRMASKEELEHGLNTDMYQCCVCEDWFHLKHVFIETDLPKIEYVVDSHELVCKSCIARLPFLTAYNNMLSQDSKQNVSNESNSSLSCKLSKFNEKSIADFEPTSICLPFGWREKLCKCEKCLTLYEQQDCSFLFDPEDTFEYYDEQRRLNTQESDEQQATGLSDDLYKTVMKETKNADAALHVVLGWEEMKQHVTDMINNKKGEPVTPDDIRRCFEELKAKRPRMDPTYENLKNL